MKNKDTGNRGENIAAEFLLSRNYVLLERNWRYRYWEIDLIVSKDDTLHFIEVKTRTSEQYGKPEESISPQKMSALKKAAAAYLDQHSQWKKIQFDVVAILLEYSAAKEIFMIEDVYF